VTSEANRYSVPIHWRRTFALINNATEPFEQSASLIGWLASVEEMLQDHFLLQHLKFRIRQIDLVLRGTSHFIHCRHSPGKMRILPS